MYITLPAAYTHGVSLCRSTALLLVYIVTNLTSPPVTVPSDTPHITTSDCTDTILFITWKIILSVYTTQLKSGRHLLSAATEGAAG